MYAKVLRFFKGDFKKANLWFQTKNPMLGDVSPAEMIACGRDKKLNEWIDNQLEGNIP